MLLNPIRNGQNCVPCSSVALQLEINLEVRVLCGVTLQCAFNHANNTIRVRATRIEGILLQGYFILAFEIDFGAAFGTADDAVPHLVIAQLDQPGLVHVRGVEFSHFSLIAA